MMRLGNKVAIIMGGSSGIGRSSANLFAKEGARVAVSANSNLTGGEETIDAITKSGGKAIFVQCDVSKASEVESLIKATKDEFGRIDVLVNSAGVAEPLTPFEEIDESSWDQIYAVNVKGIFLSAKYVVPEMKKVGGGSIVNIASLAGLRPGPLMAHYASSKGAAITLTKALALELAPLNIRINCVNPALTDTRMANIFPEEGKKEFVENIPLGRMANPEEVAYAALYLASDEAKMLTGTCINIDGGFGI